MSAVRLKTWRPLAACAGFGPTLFFSEYPADVAAAKATCAACCVAEECSATARADGEAFGVWGGEQPTERSILQAVTAAVTDRQLIELFAAASPRRRAIDVVHVLDVSTASAYRYLARAIQLGLVEKRGRNLYPASRT